MDYQFQLPRDPTRESHFEYTDFRHTIRSWPTPSDATAAGRSGSNGSLQFSSLHTTCLATLANMAPHVHRLNTYAFHGLVNLFNMLSRKFNKLVELRDDKLQIKAISTQGMALWKIRYLEKLLKNRKQLQTCIYESQKCQNMLKLSLQFLVGLLNVDGYHSHARRGCRMLETEAVTSNMDRRVGK
ncbi:Dymeclin [Corchorus olitorius]|uniref:Dymeclin n=1 Tax=Corchorus olitorius TaxID=93759 RepID=A0A1R3JKH9_9ROSI|nr:Dymeclin [Corchorus olitorius]